MPEQLNLTLPELENIAKTYDTPFHIYDEEKIRNNAREFLNIFRKEFPTFRQFFAVKALPNPHILKILYQEGMGFDCSSPSEIFISQQIGASGHDIIYTSNYTSKKDIDNALNNNVILNLDGIDELDDVDITKCNLICFRLNPNIGKTDSETKSNILGGKESKFGISSDDILQAYTKAKNKGFTEFGIHCMTGSNILSENYWYELVDILYETIYLLYSKLNIKLKFMNLGGGFGIPYIPDIKKLNIENVVKNIRKAIDVNKKKYNLDYEPDIYTESGRYITGPYGWLVSKCNRIKNSNDKIFYGLDSCMANLMRPGMYNSYHHIEVPRLNDINGKKIIANVVGTLCENNDWFAKNRILPDNIEKNDLFVIYDCGAHSQSMGFNYNGKLKCPELLLTCDKKITQIRKAETFDNLFENCFV
jgi:diaminopimelate decarboxylase